MKHGVGYIREHVTGFMMHFDYQGQAGPSSTRIAITLLDVLRYPPQLIADAWAASDWRRGRAEGVRPVVGGMRERRRDPWHRGAGYE